MLELRWYVPDKRTDSDNWAFIKKFILDGMQKANVRGDVFLPNDSLKYVTGFHESFEVDKERPRVEIRVNDEKIYFRKKGEETIHDAELLTKRVKKIRIDSDGKVLSFTVVPNNEYILKNLKTHCLKRTNLKFGLSMMITRRALFTLKDD